MLKLSTLCWSPCAISTRQVTCYGLQECASLTDAGQKIRSRKVPRNISDASKLQSLPSTNESVMENMHVAICPWSQFVTNESTETRMNQKRRFHISDVAEEVQHSSSRRPWHEPQFITSIQEWCINLCISLIRLQFRLSDYGWEQFRLSFRRGSTTMKQWCWLEGYFTYHHIIWVIVSLTPLHGHSSGTYNLSIKYPYVVGIGLLLTECLHCIPTFVKFRWPRTLKFIQMFSSELCSTVQCALF